MKAMILYTFGVQVGPDMYMTVSVRTRKYMGTPSGPGIYHISTYIDPCEDLLEALGFGCNFGNLGLAPYVRVCWVSFTNQSIVLGASIRHQALEYHRRGRPECLPELCGFSVVPEAQSVRPCSCGVNSRSQMIISEPLWVQNTYVTLRGQCGFSRMEQTAQMNAPSFGATIFGMLHVALLLIWKPYPSNARVSGDLTYGHRRHLPINRLEVPVSARTLLMQRDALTIQMLP